MIVLSLGKRKRSLHTYIYLFLYIYIYIYYLIIIFICLYIFSGLSARSDQNLLCLVSQAEYSKKGWLLAETL